MTGNGGFVLLGTEPTSIVRRNVQEPNFRRIALISLAATRRPFALSPYLSHQTAARDSFRGSG